MLLLTWIERIMMDLRTLDHDQSSREYCRDLLKLFLGRLQVMKPGQMG